MIITTLYGVVTLALIFAFIGLCVWAYSPRQRSRFAQDANIPFLGEIEQSHAGRAYHE